MIGKKGFTLIEVMIVIVILSTGILGAYSVVDYSINFVNATKVKVLAINYAREGVEGVLNIRDTNWRRWSGAGLRDACWLKVDPFNVGVNGCENDEWFGNGSYVLKELSSGGSDSQNYFALSGVSVSLDVRDDSMVDDSDKSYMLCMDDSTGFIKDCPNGTAVSSSATKTQGLFFREIQGGYLIDKNVAPPVDLVCPKGDTDGNGTIAAGECGDDRFKEKNFCSIVEYKGFATGRIKLCTAITNFKP